MKIDEINLKIDLNSIYPKYHLSLRHFLILFFGHYIVHIMHSDNSYMCIIHSVLYLPPIHISLPLSLLTLVLTLISLWGLS